MNQSEINAFITDLIMSTMAGTQPGAHKTMLCLDSAPVMPNLVPVEPGENTVLRIIPGTQVFNFAGWPVDFPLGSSPMPVNDTADEGDEQPTEFQVGDRVMVIDEAGFEGILYTGDIVTVSGICGDHRLIGIHEVPGQWFAPARFITATAEMEANRVIEDLEDELQELEDEAQELRESNADLTRWGILAESENDRMKSEVIDLTARIQELLDANNAEVERRRAAEARVAELSPMVVQQSLIISGLLADRMFNN